ncbi:calcium/proton exchanger [Patescibacteria group bacterium]|nr:calcium/proton exchanger [Patescibacteria group bacterium]
MNRIFQVLLVLPPLVLLAAYFHVSPLLLFILSALAIVPLAKYIGDATEEIALHTTPAVGGLMNATFGNATELIIGIFALHAGLIEIVKASIVGSILGNLLLVLGMALFFGGIKRERQYFNATAAKASASMLILAIIAFAIPAVFEATSPNLSAPTSLSLSVIIALIMIVAYFGHLFFTLHTHKHLYRSEEDLIVPKGKIKESIFILAFATIAVAVMSDLLVGTITPLVAQLGWTQLFIGVIFIAIVGNVAEHVSAIQAAVRDRMDLALSIALGSAIQIAMLAAPLLVLASLFFPIHLNLVFTLFELVSLVVAVWITNAVIEDGESTWLEGAQLLAAYGIMAIAFFLHP